MLTVRDLAIDFVVAKRAAIYDYSGDITDSLAKLWQRVEAEINPLLVKHGELPIDQNGVYEVEPSLWDDIVSPDTDVK